MIETELTEQEVIDAGLMPVAPQTEQEEIDSSFADADAHYWGEVRLDPYSAQRQIAAQSMGMRFGSLTAEDMDEIERTASYPNMMQDAIIVLYLCFPRGRDGKQGIEESYAACDARAQKTVRRRMLDWACDQGITTGSPQYKLAVELMLKIVREARVNQFVPDGKKGTVRPN